jgi:hypothetical protein
MLVNESGSLPSPGLSHSEAIKRSCPLQRAFYQLILADPVQLFSFSKAELNLLAEPPARLLPSLKYL